MNKDALTDACFEQDLDEVRALIASGVVMDGSDNEMFVNGGGLKWPAPDCTPLGEACRNKDGSAEKKRKIIEMLLQAGAPVDEPNARTRTAFYFACVVGEAAPIGQLADAGADVHQKTHEGNGIITLIKYSHQGPRVSGLRALLDLGVSPRAQNERNKDLVDQVGTLWHHFTSGDRNSKASGTLILELMEIVAHREPDWPKMQKWLVRAREAKLKGDAKLLKLKEKIDKLKASLSAKDFEKKALSILGKRASGRREELTLATRELVMAPEVITHESWPNLLRGLLKLTVSYGDLTQKCYGKRLTLEQMDDDEGSALEKYDDENLSTIELCLQACQAPEASKRSDFTNLVLEIFQTKYESIKDMSYGDEQAVELIQALEKEGHASAAQLRTEAQRCFVNAAWEDG